MSPANPQPALARATHLVPLHAPTAPEWVATALAQVDRLLDDHCQCELKAASNALALVGRNPEKDSLVTAMSALAREEMQHYRRVRDLLKARGHDPTRPLPSPYLKGINRERLGGEQALLDDLLVAALVEARSCDRFVALVDGVRGPFAGLPGAAELDDLYASLAQSESGHAQLFVDLAREYFPADLVGRELERRATIEADVIAALPRTPRMHGGHGV